MRRTPRINLGENSINGKGVRLLSRITRIDLTGVAFGNTFTSHLQPTKSTTPNPVHLHSLATQPQMSHLSPILPTPSSQSPKLAKTLAWLASVSAGDLQGIGTHLDDHYEHFFHPATVGKKVHSKEEWMAHSVPMFEMFRNTDVAVFDYLESEEKVVLHFKFISQISETGQDHFNHEVICIFSFTGSDENIKIRTLKEFSDTSSYEEYWPKLDAHKANAGSVIASAA